MATAPRRDIDLNCDLGEAPDSIRSGRDREIMRHVTSVNIACGGHAGDASTMRDSILAARELGVSIGSHPSYPDRAGFGRVELAMSIDELRRSVREQIASLHEIARVAGLEVSHVKPHGALYHAAMRSPDIARAIAEAADHASETQPPNSEPARPAPRSVSSSVPARATLAFVGLAGSPGCESWRRERRRTLAEAFADRAYRPDGTLAPRSAPGAIIDDPARAAAQALDIALHQRVLAIDGTLVPIVADTICIHGDSPAALDVAAAIRRTLDGRGVVVRSPAGGDR
jgi:5-oxoprolinase (ATP-hydrolysing) subunit A